MFTFKPNKEFFFAKTLRSDYRTKRIIMSNIPENTAHKAVHIPEHTSFNSTDTTDSTGVIQLPPQPGGIITPTPPEKDSFEDIKKLAEAAELRYWEPLPEQQVYASIHQEGEYIPIMTFGNVSAITGRAKSGKTTFSKMLMAAGITGNFKNKLYTDIEPEKSTVLFIDTEQSANYYSLKTCNDICRYAGLSEKNDRFKAYNLMTYSLPDKLKVLQYYIQHTPNLGFIFLDNIRDFVSSPNNEEECNQFVRSLCKWAFDRNIHICCVLHLNKGNGLIRGHLGTEVLNKAETVIKVESQETGEKVISAYDTRNKPFTDLLIEWNGHECELIDPNGNIRRDKDIVHPSRWSKDIQTEQLRPILEGKQMTATQLLEVLTAQWKDSNGISRRRLQAFIEEIQKNGVLKEIEPDPNEKKRGRKAIYFTLA